MRRVLLIMLLALASSAVARAQSFGYVNTEKILEKIPEYTVAQEQIDRLKKQYDAQIESEMKIVETLYNKYQTEKSSLSQSQREIKESEIISKERAAKELQKSYFGQDGALAAKSKELLTPIKDKVQSVIEKIAAENGIVLVFDVATAQGIIYYNQANDMTAKVIQRLNIR